ncbi:S-layer homology domain-containing protein [Patescibacteria group bacterium]
MAQQKQKKPHHFKYRKHPHHKEAAIKRFFAWFALIVFLTSAVYLVEQNITTFQASIIPTQQAPAFDGTVLPVQKAPDWVALTSAEWNNSYSAMPSGKIENISVYNPNKLKLSTDSLQWGDPQDDAVRNAKITYSVPYMGSYALDGKEYTGSHLAVDIKVPSGTPVYAIGNGIVSKTSTQSSGFGNHIVIEHKNFPAYNNSNTNTTYYSNYAHLLSIKVNEGAVVRKGDLIGYVGSTGTSTTPHLHFQIDTDSAPWHPFWPFTSKEASDAGMSFSQAVNGGLNQDIAIQNTINPMLYVQNFKSGAVYVADDTSNDTTSSTSSSTTTSSSTSTSSTIDDVIVDDTTTTVEDPEREYITFEIHTGGDTFTPNEEKEIVVKAVDRSGSRITNYAPETAVRVEVIQGSATVSPRRLNADDFSNGIAKIALTPKGNAAVKIKLATDTVIKESPLLSPGIFVDIGTAHPHFNAISFLKDEGVIQGYPDGSFKPENDVSRVEVIKFILEGIDADLDKVQHLSFTDTDTEQWYADYLYTAKNLGIVQGYLDGTFKPTNSVNRAEFLKMLIKASQIDIDPIIHDSFKVGDVDEADWFAPYVQFAVDANIIELENNKFDPAAEMKREEVAEAIYRIKVLQETGASKFTADLINELELHAG